MYNNKSGQEPRDIHPFSTMLHMLAVCRPRWQPSPSTKASSQACHHPCLLYAYYYDYAAVHDDPHDVILLTRWLLASDELSVVLPSTNGCPRSKALLLIYQLPSKVTGWVWRLCTARVLGKSHWIKIRPIKGPSIRRSSLGHSTLDNSVRLRNPSDLS